MYFEVILIHKTLPHETFLLFQRKNICRYVELAEGTELHIPWRENLLQEAAQKQKDYLLLQRSVP